MENQKLATLIEQLNKRTQEGKVRWEKTINKNEFLTSFHNYSVYISIYSSQYDYFSDAPNYILQISNEDGEIVEQVHDTDFQNHETSPSPTVAMEELYFAARRDAMGVDKAVDALLAELTS